MKAKARGTRRQVAIVALVGLMSTMAAGSARATEWPWTTWLKEPGNPVYSHSSGVASDPTVLDDGIYRMIVSGGNLAGNSLIEATSANSYTWSTLSNGNSGIVVPGLPGKWDANVEMPELIKTGTTYRLFYSGYKSSDVDPAGFFYSDLGLATSTNGTTFTRSGANPVMTRSVGWYDQDGITDATIVRTGSTLYMIYVGWCGRTGPVNCPLYPGKDFEATLLTAVSTNNGASWTKGNPISTNAGSLQPNDGLHPDLVVAPDGHYTIFYNADAPGGCSGGREPVKQARSLSAFGPFELSPTDPALCVGSPPTWEGTDGGFPAVINDGGVGKLWYTGVIDATATYRIGMATSTF